MATLHPPIALCANKKLIFYHDKMIAESILLCLLSGSHCVVGPTFLLVLDTLMMFRRRCIIENSYSSTARLIIYILALANIILLIANINMIINIFDASCEIELGVDKRLLGKSLLLWIISVLVASLESPIVMIMIDNNEIRDDFVCHVSNSMMASLILYVSMFICSLFI